MMKTANKFKKMFLYTVPTNFYCPFVQQVAAKDTEIGTWSDWSVAVHATPWIEDPLPITSTTEVDFATGEL